MNCVNGNCAKEISEGIIVNADGDLACSEECAAEYKKLVNYFLEQIVGDVDKFLEWMDTL